MLRNVVLLNINLFICMVYMYKLKVYDFLDNKYCVKL